MLPNILNADGAVILYVGDIFDDVEYFIIGDEKCILHNGLSGC